MTDLRDSPGDGCHNGVPCRREEKDGGTLIQKSIRALSRLEHMHKAAVESRVSMLGLHRNQHFILVELEREEKLKTGKMLSQKDLVDRFGISPAAIAIAMKKLESDGYITRSASIDDNRKNEIKLTEKGRDILARTRKIFDSVDSIVSEGLTDAELIAFLTTVEKMQKNLKSIPEVSGQAYVPKEKPNERT